MTKVKVKKVTRVNEDKNINNTPVYYDLIAIIAFLVVMPFVVLLGLGYCMFIDEGTSFKNVALFNSPLIIEVTGQKGLNYSVDSILYTATRETLNESLKQSGIKPRISAYETEKLKYFNQVISNQINTYINEGFQYREGLLEYKLEDDLGIKIDQIYVTYRVNT